MKIAAFPARYVQGPGALGRFGAEVAPFARRPLVLADAGLPDGVTGALGVADGVAPRLAATAAACTDEAIAATVAEARAAGADAIAGMGGGKVIDLGRAVADAMDVPFVAIPTVAASDAPCSAVVIVYDAAGAVGRAACARVNPRLVLVDTAVIAAAPPRFLAAGIGDALATYYEAEACARSGALNKLGGQATRLALAAAAVCRDTVLDHGLAAMEECRAGTPGEAFEAVVEANILLSGLGFESGGLAAAHAIHNGLAELHETHGALHGEKVAFGTLVELVLGEASEDEIRRIATFLAAAGLPVTLAELGIGDVEAALPVIVERAIRPTDNIHNEPRPMTAAIVAEAIRRADALGLSIQSVTA
ncbi:glycerol dehydrogenase [Stappia sp. 22II-S9-Z10]|nr:glycerol dehydrogenase [Stappia sp. 22II-S9-Z10]